MQALNPRYEPVLNGKWALVVEDDAHSLVAISSILRDLGVRFKRNTTGANVTQQISEMKPPPDFILLDIDLPNGNALAIQQRILALPRLRSIPIIALADEDERGLQRELDQAGFAAFVLKPIPRREFAEMLERLIANEPV